MPKGAGKVEQRQKPRQGLRGEGCPAKARRRVLSASLEHMPRAVALAVRGGTVCWSVVLSNGSVKLKFILTRCDKHSRREAYVAGK